MARVSRNDPCPCGSGLKYKRCHQGKDVERPRSSSALLFAILALLIGAGAVAVVIGVSRGPDSVSSSRRRVWSPEHGHWHDEGVPLTSSRSLPFDPRSALPNGPRPAPPGTPPPGKVWSPEHGHWHDVVERNGATNAPPPIGITYGPAPNR
jgi:SEC-C motif-containing protein